MIRRLDRLLLGAALVAASAPAWLAVLRVDDAAADRLALALCRAPDGGAVQPRALADTSASFVTRSVASAPSR